MKKKNHYYVRNLPLPELLVHLLEDNKWNHPGELRIKKVIPFFKEEIIFLQSVREMELESHILSESDGFFFEADSNKNPKANNLPWLDTSLSFFIAVNKSIGADIGIALDYRTSIENPRVIGNNWHSNISGCPWQEISSTFEEFVNLLYS
ncbi:MAG: hypothetical protein AAF806_18780 [Bacteroidota bacterium]